MPTEETTMVLAIGKIADIINLDKRTLEAIRVYVEKQWLPRPKKQALGVIDSLLNE